MGRANNVYPTFCQTHIPLPIARARLARGFRPSRQALIANQIPPHDVQLPKIPCLGTAESLEDDCIALSISATERSAIPTSVDDAFAQGQTRARCSIADDAKLTGNIGVAEQGGNFAGGSTQRILLVDGRIV